MTAQHKVTFNDRTLYEGTDEKKAAQCWEEIEFLAMQQGYPAQWLRDGEVYCEFERDR
jgi:hypothetical protein